MKQQRFFLINRFQFISIVIVAFYLIDILLTRYFLPSRTNDTPFEMPYNVLPDGGPDLQPLPNLTTIPWFEFPNLNSSVPIDSFSTRPFDPVLPIEVRSIFTQILDDFQRLMIRIRLQDKWFITDGALLGSLRSHDFIPRDDDLDVSVTIRYRHILRSSIPKYAQYFLLTDFGVYDTICNKKDAVGNRLTQRIEKPHLDVAGKPHSTL